MSIGLPSGVLSWFSDTLGVAIGGAGDSFLRQAASARRQNERGEAERDRRTRNALNHGERSLLTRSKQW